MKVSEVIEKLKKRLSDGTFEDSDDIISLSISYEREGKMKTYGIETEREVVILQNGEAK